MMVSFIANELGEGVFFVSKVFLGCKTLALSGVTHFLQRLDDIWRSGSGEIAARRASGDQPASLKMLEMKFGLVFSENAAGHGFITLFFATIGSGDKAFINAFGDQPAARNESIIDQTNFPVLLRFVAERQNQRLSSVRLFQTGAAFLNHTHFCSNSQYTV